MRSGELKGLDIPSGAFQAVGRANKASRLAQVLHADGVDPAKAWRMGPAQRDDYARRAGAHSPSVESWGAAVILLAGLRQ